jgi:hypothetical protein
MTATRINVRENGRLEGVSVVGFNGSVAAAETPLRCAPLFTMQADAGEVFVSLRRDADGSVWADRWDVAFSESVDAWPGDGTKLPEREDAYLGWEILVLTPVDAAQYAELLPTKALGDLHFLYQPAKRSRDILDAIADDRFGELRDARKRADVERAALRLAAVSSDRARLALAAARLVEVESAKARVFSETFAVEAGPASARAQRLIGAPARVSARARDNLRAEPTITNRRAA